MDFSKQSISATQIQPQTQCDSLSSAPSASSVPVSVCVPYDQLVIAVGAEPATFNIPGVREHCMFIKEIDDGVKCDNTHVYIYVHA